MTAAVFALIAIALFATSLVLSIVNLASRAYPAPISLGLIWLVWGVGLVFLILSWLL